MVTEVFTVKYCDPHASREEKVEATEVIQFAHEGSLREVDSCEECHKEYTAWIEPLVDYSRPVKRTRKTKTTAPAEPATASDDSGDSED
ncbi:hypothetical protein J4H86_26090 [Spiractinospora alimapuensis]|uniref:hypothetical protein n=1 Tax=Spiractinospora alimapuensis TaxID=2820884 RepID=UPI001F4513C0|nr:hypothetical protein [Spiractinospora alimapuensis]QVQ52133.1 hypothetical protein J4H86_26090 [Spiractinospora alimapuensis]